MHRRRNGAIVTSPINLNILNVSKITQSVIGKTWKGKYYNTKQVEAYTVQEGDDLIIVTVIVKYF